jgi:hypothetical protein
MLAFVFLPAISGDSHCPALVPLTNTVVLLGPPMLPTWWVKISTYLHLEPFLLIAYMHLVLDRLLLLLLCYNFRCYNSYQHYYYYCYLWSVLLLYSYHYQFNLIITIIMISCFTVKCFLFIISFPYHFLLVYLFVCFSVIMCSCNLPLTLCCVCPLCTSVYLHCAVSVIDTVAVDSAHK